MSSTLRDQVDAGSLSSVTGPVNERVAMVMGAQAETSLRQARLGARSAYCDVWCRAGAKGTTCAV